MLDKNKFELHVFGNITDSVDIHNCANFIFYVHGFQKIDFTLQSSHNTLRVFPSLSEVLGRGQLESILSGDQCYTYWRGYDPVFNDLFKYDRYYMGIEEFLKYIIGNQYNFKKKNDIKLLREAYKNYFHDNLDILCKHVKSLHS